MTSKLETPVSSVARILQIFFPGSGYPIGWADQLASFTAHGTVKDSQAKLAW